MDTKDVGFLNTGWGFLNIEGPQTHQAVALWSGSNCSLFYICSFDAFQGNLYFHSHRQFYMTVKSP